MKTYQFNLTIVIMVAITIFMFNNTDCQTLKANQIPNANQLKYETANPFEEVKWSSSNKNNIKKVFAF